MSFLSYALLLATAAHGVEPAEVEVPTRAHLQIAASVGRLSTRTPAVYTHQSRLAGGLDLTLRVSERWGIAAFGRWDPGPGIEQPLMAVFPECSLWHTGPGEGDPDFNTTVPDWQAGGALAWSPVRGAASLADETAAPLDLSLLVGVSAVARDFYQIDYPTTGCDYVWLIGRRTRLGPMGGVRADLWLTPALGLRASLDGGFTLDRQDPYAEPWEAGPRILWTWGIASAAVVVRHPPARD